MRPGTDPLPTIYRRQRGHDLMYQVWDDGRLIDVDERLALSQQRAGKCRIKTLEPKPR